MRPSYWLVLALVGAVACGSSEADPSVSNVRGSGDDDSGDDDDEDDDDEADGKKPDAGRDAGRDSGKPSSSMGDPDDDTMAGAMGEEKCYSQSVSANPNSPDILIVLDRSASMLGVGPGIPGLPGVPGTVDRWTPSVSAVKRLTSELGGTVAFGLMLFPAGVTGLNLNDLLLDPNGLAQLGCEPGEVNIQVDLNTAEEIGALLDSSPPDTGATPTGVSLRAALTAMTQETCSDCAPREKYVLLVTDGAPTCGAGGIMTTEEDIVDAVSVIEELAAANVKTYVVGYGTASDPVAADAMDRFAQAGGTGTHFAVEDEATLIGELTQIAGALVSCEFEIATEVDDPALLNVEIDGQPYAQGPDWTYDAASQKVILHPEGGACPILRDAKVHKVEITRECEPVMVL